MFDKAFDRSRIAQAAYARYFDKKVRVRKQFKDGSSVFLDPPQARAKTTQQSYEHIAKSKLLPCLSVRFESPSRRLQTEDGAELPISVDRCTLAPPDHVTRPYPNADGDTTDFPIPHPVGIERTDRCVTTPAQHSSKTTAAQMPLISATHNLDSSTEPPPPTMHQSDAPASNNPLR